MTKHKQYSLRGYDTFAGDAPAESASAASESIYPEHGDSDKSRSAAAEAQRLGSLGSWADRFSGGTPATVLTPAASTVDGDERPATDIRYPRLPHDADPSDPPPVYTPEASTVAPSISTSPVIARAALVSETVSTPMTENSPLQPSQAGPRSQARNTSVHVTYESDDDDGDDDDDDDDDPSASFLPEPVQHPYQHQTTSSDPDTVTSPAPKSSRRRWCIPRRRRSRGCGYRGMDRKERVRRFKRTCWFIFALLACLWLMIPGLCRSFSDKGETQLPNIDTQPKQPFPVPSREYRQHETSHSITGTHQLYDLLDLSTTSGSISIVVHLQPGDKPAVLRLSSTSGSINVAMVPSSGIGGFFQWKRIVAPDGKVRNVDRVLKTEISTKSGSVSGNIVHGNGGSTSISTTSGSISVSLYPYRLTEYDPLSTLTTSTTSGSQSVKVLSHGSIPGYDAASPPIRALKSSHTTYGSGSISVHYPSEWEGRLHALVKGSGSLSATGSGLEVQKQGRRELFGWKGDAAEHAQIIEITEMGSGSLSFRC